IVERLRVFFGEEAAPLYEVNERSLQRLTGYARNSIQPGCQAFAAGLDLALEVVGEQLRSRPVLESPQLVGNYLKLHFAGQEYESFAVLFLDAQHHVIAVEDLFRGTLTQTSVYPREIVKRALVLNAVAVILTHNHPSGSLQPSRADEVLTQTLKSALALIDVRVLDHIIVGAGATLSMAEHAFM
ncbi:MAG: DNA repair protein RadC, partial [Burkholderiales bacterium]